MADSFSSCFVSGVVFLAISFFKIREAIVNAIPMSLKFAIGGGIGLFLALIALKMPELLSRTKQHWSVWAILNNLLCYWLYLAFTYCNFASA
ncbi:Guanine/hypoxanthine permease PbuG [Acinetobacter baumannii]|nr:Guanine/hypoxanthine permease PbuG [Acinetobacter baumannii]